MYFLNLDKLKTINMTFPTLPTDNIYKFLLLGGIILIFFSISNSIDSGDKLDLKRDEYKLKGIELKYQNKLDSLEITSIKKVIDTLNFKLKSDKNFDKNILNKELDANIQLLSKKNILTSKREEEISLLKKKRERIFSDYTDSLNGSLGLYIIGLIVFGIVLAILLEMDSISNRNNKHKIKKELKEILCQSCGMILKFDLHPHVEAELCSTCYDGNKYREPDLTYKQMIERVEKNLKDQKLTKRQIKRSVSQLRKLNRWVRTIRW